MQDPAAAARAALDLLAARITANSSGESSSLGLGAAIRDRWSEAPPKPPATAAHRLITGALGSSGAALEPTYSHVPPPSVMADNFLASLAPPNLYLQPPPPPPPPPPPLPAPRAASGGGGGGLVAHAPRQKGQVRVLPIDAWCSAQWARQWRCTDLPQPRRHQSSCPAASSASVSSS